MDRSTCLGGISLTEVPMLAWILFLASVLALLALDLGYFNRKAHVIKPREAMLQVAFFVSAGVIFNIIIYIWMGSQSGLEFTTGYIMELMLSVDNLFVFVLVFASFCVPTKDQHKVLFFGILGALVFRFLFIMAGVTLVETFHWILYIFGAFLVFTGIRMVVQKGEKATHPDQNIMVRFSRKFMNITSGYEGDKFFVRKPNEYGKLVLWGTPMFITLLVVETTDILFAVDSIPAILGITTNAFIVFSSNAFAILGLRSMYFALAHVMNLFCYLKYGLAGILSFVGIKMLVADYVHIDVLLSLTVIVVILGVAIIASWLKNRPTGASPAGEEAGSTGTCPALHEAEGSENGEACPALKELRETEGKNKK
jgi:tellurite resistance protein TerC